MPRSVSPENKERKSRPALKKSKHHRRKRSTSSESSDRSSSASSSPSDRRPRERSRSNRKRSSSNKQERKRKQSSSSSSSPSSCKKKRKKEKKEKKKKKKKDKKEKKKMKKKEKEKQRKTSMDGSITMEAGTESHIKNLPAESAVSVGPKPRIMKPMTKEEWEKQQSVMRHVYDEESGRTRLIKGDGEVMEEIVSKDRHREINKMSTQGDGKFYAAKMGLR